MKNFTILALLGLTMVAMTLVGCGKKSNVAEEIPATTETVATQEEATPPPPPPPPPPVRSLENGQFETVYFDFDKAVLRTDAKASLDNNYKLFQEFADAIVEVQGHCDERGTIEYNLALGERRAKATAAYLISLGVNAARLKTISYGEERPAAPGQDESAWSKNRRAEFNVVSQ